jgi:hypothetical protein
VAAAVAVALLWGGYAWWTSEPALEPPKPPAPLEAAGLCTEFAQDSAGANQKYGNQNVRITGKVRSTDVGNKTMMFEGESGGSWSVLCHFLERDEVKEMEPGMEVVVQGRCAGQGRPEANVEFWNCMIISLK